MSGLEALLSNLKRAFAPGSAGSPVGVAARRHRRLCSWSALPCCCCAGSPRRATRSSTCSWPPRPPPARSREISEIDAFARRASASAEDLKARVRKLRTGHFQQVEDLHRPLQLHPHLDADRAQPRPAAGARRQLDDAAAGADGGGERVAVEGAQEPAGAALSRHQRLRHAVPGGLLQAARDHAAARADGARQAAAADPPAQGDGRALARGERGAQGRADAHDPAGARLPDGADLPPHAARGPAVLAATSRPAASRSRRRRCSTRTSPPT